MPGELPVSFETISARRSSGSPPPAICQSVSSGCQPPATTSWSTESVAGPPARRREATIELDGKPARRAGRRRRPQRAGSMHQRDAIGLAELDEARLRINPGVGDALDRNAGVLGLASRPGRRALAVVDTAR